MRASKEVRPGPRRLAAEELRVVIRSQHNPVLDLYFSRLCSAFVALMLDIDGGQQLRGVAFSEGHGFF